MDIRQKPKSTSIGIQCNRYLDETDPLVSVESKQRILGIEEMDQSDDSDNDLGHYTPQQKYDDDYIPDSECDHISDDYSEIER